MRRPGAVLALLMLLVTGMPSLLAATRLSLPSIPDFRLPSAGVVDTVFPAATGGRSPYSYSVSGLPAGISFSSSTRRARGTLPTVLVDTTYTVTYSVRDSRSATDSVTFTAVVTAATAPPPDPSPPDPPPPPDDDDDDDDDGGPGVSIAGLLPFTVSETGSGRKEYRFSLSSTADVTVSLTGMDRDIDCRVNDSRCTNRGGTTDDSWSGTLGAGTHTVTVYPFRGGSGSWTLSVSGTAPPPQPDPPTGPVDAVRLHSLPFTVSETGEGRKEYRFRLESRTEVSVSLTGMNRDIDCRVSSSSCTNRGGTRDDSWNGTLEAGTHTVTVYPYGCGLENWTLSASGPATPPPPGPTPPPPPTDDGSIVKTGVNVSASRTYPLTLSRRAEVSVELTGMTTDFDCTVSGNPCSNRGGTADDSWSGSLNAGEHKIVVYPYGGGSGNYTLTVSAEAPGTGGTSGTRTQVTTPVKASRTNVSTSRTYNFTLARRARVDVALTGLTIDFDCRVGSSRCTNRWGTLDDSWSGDLGEGNHKRRGVPVRPRPRELLADRDGHRDGGVCFATAGWRPSTHSNRRVRRQRRRRRRAGLLRGGRHSSG